MRVFTDEGKGVNQVYADMIWTIMSEGAEIGTDWHGAADKAPSITKELHPATVIITNPRRKLVTSRVINVTFALAEVLWILEGRNDVQMLRFYNSNIGNFSDNGETFNAAYGQRMRVHFGHDQIDDVIRTLKADPNSRQATIVISSPKRDRGWEADPRGSYNWDTPVLRHETKDRACNVLAHLMIRDGKLDWMQIIRSNDAVWGTPYNWMQWMHMQEYIASCLGIAPGQYYHVVDSLHIYEHHFDEANGIRHNDLYALLGKDHPPFVPYNLQTLHAMEEDIRTGGNRRIAMNLPQCWQVAMGLFIAHAYYSTGENDACMRALVNVAVVDPIYALAQARFYWTNRWRKFDGAPRAAMTDMFGSEAAEWICSA